MSALFLMCRTAILGFVLIWLAAGGAHAAQDRASARVHGKTTARHHLTRHAQAAHARRSAAAAHTRTPIRLKTKAKPTAQQAGRRAGVAIRRRLEEKAVTRRAAATGDTQAQTMARPKTAGTLRADKTKRETEPIEAASASSLLLLPGLGTEETERARAPRPAADGESDAPAEDTHDTAATTAEGMAPREATASGAGREEAALRMPHSAMPAPLRGSVESLDRQNARLDAEGLERIEDEADLADRIEHKLLVPIPASSALTVNDELPAAHRYCRPWTARFLADLARAHDAAFHRPLEVNSAVRTIEYQKRLMESNGNAAPAEGDIVSPHLTGATIDIAKSGLSRQEIAWMRQRLFTLEAAGTIDVEEEFRQSCFHITVYKSYVPARPARPATGNRRGGAVRRSAEAGSPTAQGL